MIMISEFVSRCFDPGCSNYIREYTRNAVATCKYIKFVPTIEHNYRLIKVLQLSKNSSYNGIPYLRRWLHTNGIVNHYEKKIAKKKKIRIYLKYNDEFNIII